VPGLIGSPLRLYVVFTPLPPVVAYVNKYPLFAPLARRESIKQAEVAEGIAGGTQLVTAPPSLRDGKSDENPTV